MLDWGEIIARLGVATVVGGMIGLNRDLHNKPTGVRTLGLVALGSALVVLATEATVGATDPSMSSRVAQGVITGVGFLGAGVIFRSGGDDPKVHGMTTAASIWLTAGLGIACGLGAWRIIAVAMFFMAVLLIFGGRFEQKIHRVLMDERAAKAKRPPPHTDPIDHP